MAWRFYAVAAAAAYPWHRRRHVGERLALATEVSHIVRRYAVDATADEAPVQPPVTPPPPPESATRATSPLGDPGE